MSCPCNYDLEVEPAGLRFLFLVFSEGVLS
jgi:hypothetical protein